MNTTSTDPHLGALTLHGDVHTFPSHAELVRTLLATGRFATLTTLTIGSSDGERPTDAVEGGLPYASFVAYSVLDDGSPLVCISDLAEHTRNARVDGRAGMLLSGLPVDDRADPLDRPRASLVGRLEPYVPTEAEVRAHVEHHPGVLAYVDFPDFSWWRLTISAARYVGGFGHMSWVDGAEIANAAPDPVLAGSQAAVDHMNLDHADALLDLAHHVGGLVDATAARVHTIDRRGLTLYADVPGSGPLATVRVAFAGDGLTSIDDVRPAVVALTREARAARRGAH